MNYPEPASSADTTVGADQERALRVLALAIIGGTVIIGVVIAIVLGVGSANLLLIALTIVLVALPFSVASMWVHLVPSSATRRRWESNRKL